MERINSSTNTSFQTAEIADYLRDQRGQPLSRPSAPPMPFLEEEHEKQILRLLKAAKRHSSSGTNSALLELCKLSNSGKLNCDNQRRINACINKEIFLKGQQTIAMTDIDPQERMKAVERIQELSKEREFGFLWKRFSSKNINETFVAIALCETIDEATRKKAAEQVTHFQSLFHIVNTSKNETVRHTASFCIMSHQYWYETNWLYLFESMHSFAKPSYKNLLMIALSDNMRIEDRQIAIQKMFANYTDALKVAHKFDADSSTRKKELFAVIEKYATKYTSLLKTVNDGILQSLHNWNFYDLTLRQRRAAALYSFTPLAFNKRVIESILPGRHHTNLAKRTQVLLDIAKATEREEVRKFAIDQIRNTLKANNNDYSMVNVLTNWVINQRNTESSEQINELLTQRTTPQVANYSTLI